ncbi:protein serine/threonine phosphatase 2C [Jaminaea rosea]|uniref:Protein serine/threonine phosphatase 2C n=1 Tax=Jaminaea rosea TaxID=1569628 RepID=A0A316UNY1_9BASI|nr:protein serine/threonine phosphatase 2C [Jaminaea rosea]PWN26478.1 protein serine/threonine phosphatase 2C [Jaminaea rosea]
MAARRTLFSASQLRLRPASLSRGRQFASGSSQPTPPPSSSSASTTKRYEKQRRNEWIVIAVSGAIAAGGAYYWTNRPKDVDDNVFAPPSSPEPSSSSRNFSITVRHPSTGERMTKVFTMLSDSESTKRLRQNERVVDVQDAGAVSRYYVNSVAANAPIEDRSSQAILPHANSASAAAFFAVMDGHAGWDTSELLSKRLIPEVALHIDAAHRLAEDRARNPGLAAKIKAALGAGSGSEEEIRSGLVKEAISTAFLGLDKRICETPIEMLKRGGAASEGYQAMLPALSGSCALLTYVDSARDTVYVACTGDSRALAGYQDAKTGQWSVEPLSEDQTGRNIREQERMRREHPIEEADHVVMRGRVLGGLEPTRAFGDARYKWDREMQAKLREAFLPAGSGGRGPPQLLKTPPYVTARPMIQSRRIAADGKQLRFIVMATDGLWDMLSNEEVGSLVAGHLSEVKGRVGKEELEGKVFGKAAAPAISDQQAVLSSSHHPLARAQGQQVFAFQDENLATHLVRNALGGGGAQRVNAYLAIPAGDARRYRDDITVNVVLLGEKQASPREAKL